MRPDQSPRVLHVLHSLACGGTERALISLLRQLGGRAASHGIVTLRSAGPLATEVPECVSIHALSRCGRARSASFSLARIARRFQADIIHARNTGTWMDALIAGILARKPAILGFHGWEEEERFDTATQRRVRWALRLGAHFASVSRAAAQCLHQQCGVPFDRITHLPNGVDIKRFEHADESRRRGVRDEFGVSSNDILIGALGSLRTIKGFRFLLQAFANCALARTSVRLLVAGEGPERIALESLSRDLGIADRVTFIGQCNDVPGFLAALDVFVCSSLGEGMSNALLEAMASGLPIVATNVGDNSALIRDGLEGMIIPPADADAMTLALHTLTADEELRKRFASAARNRAANFDLAKMARGYESLYQSIAETRIRKLRSQLVTAATAC